MGKKINPKVLRLNIVTEHTSKWFASKQLFPVYLKQDIMLRKMIKERLKDAGLSRVEIRRSGKKIEIVIASSKPGVIIGRNGAGIDDLKKTLKRQFFGSEKVAVGIEIEEVRRPELDAQLVLRNIINQLEKRVPFRRAMKRSIETVMGAGAKGIKIICAGRLNGVEIARTETLVEGSVPTHTLRADIDYARAAAHTIYGSIGVKVWIYRGQIFADSPKPVERAEPRERRNRQPRQPQVDRSGTKKRTVVKAGQVKSFYVDTPES
ncbi:MAG: 30S ribosomal protein S3 [Candidatus Kerfeldbacteria bacterium]|nr:30S ribosomal protein S3 [Candidatus Kerfeldbacteria bacterium]